MPMEIWLNPGVLLGRLGLVVRFADAFRPLFGRIQAVALHLCVKELAMNAE
jgi:hypothetical protein